MGKSASGLAHSMTLARFPTSRVSSQGGAGTAIALADHSLALGSVQSVSSHISAR
jgi:hypothetical protein